MKWLPQRRAEWQAELRVLYRLRDLILPRIRELEAVLAAFAEKGE